MKVQSAVRGLMLAVGVAILAVLACDVPTGLPRVESRFLLPIDDVIVPVTGVASSVAVRRNLQNIALNSEVKSATLRVTPLNPSGATGVLDLEITGGSARVSGPIDVSGGSRQEITISGAQMQAFIDNVITIKAGGRLCRTGGCGVSPPYPVVTLQGEMEVLVEYGGKQEASR